MRWMKLEPIIQSEVSQKEKHQYSISSVQFSHSVVSDSLQPHELQHARPPCPSPSPRVHSDSHPLSPWCHPAISSSVVPFSSCPQSLPASVFSNESTLRMRWPKYWSFSFSIIPSKEIPGLISFRMDWLVIANFFFSPEEEMAENLKASNYPAVQLGSGQGWPGYRPYFGEKLLWLHIPCQSHILQNLIAILL